MIFVLRQFQLDVAKPSKYSQTASPDCLMRSASCEFLAVPQMPICAATTRAATFFGAIFFLIFPVLMPAHRCARRLRHKPYNLSIRVRNPSSSGDISCARLFSGQPCSHAPLSMSSFTNCRKARFNSTIGLVESVKGSSQRCIKSGEMISSTTA